MEIYRECDRPRCGYRKKELKHEKWLGFVVREKRVHFIYDPELKAVISVAIVGAY